MTTTVPAASVLEGYFGSCLEILRLRLQRKALWVRASAGTDPLRAFGREVVSDERAESLLRRSGPSHEAAFYRDSPEAARLENELEEATARLDALRASLREAERVPPLERLVDVFALDDLDRDLVLLALAPELDPSIADLYAYVQDDPALRGPTPGLAAALFEPTPARRARLAPGAPLRRWALVQVDPDGEPFYRRRLSLDERVVHFLTGVNYVDRRVEALARPSRRVAVDDVSAGAAARSMAAAVEQGSWPRVNLVGGPRAPLAEVAHETATSLGMRAIEIERVDDALSGVLAREAALERLVYVIDTGAEDSAPTAVARLEAPVIATGRRPLHGGGWARIEVEALSSAAQTALWERLVPRIDAAELVQQFDLSAAEVLEAAAELAGDRDATSEHAWAICRARTRRAGGHLSDVFVSGASWDDIVLPPDVDDQLREIAAQASLRREVYETWGFGARLSSGRGTTALFSGPSGTGKTMAAACLANELGLDLRRLDLAGVVSKYIGETEKNLSVVFEAAEASGAILFFDEADALFGKRSEVKDSHDRYANIEIDYLLQRMEDYHGIAILATNRKAHIDSAFVRRLRFIVDFPFPDPRSRKEMWHRAFPSDTPVDELDYDALARLELAGGSIRNIAVNAAFLAASRGDAVGMDHVLHAARREYAKVGKLVNAAELTPRKAR